MKPSTTIAACLLINMNVCAQFFSELPNTPLVGVQDATATFFDIDGDADADLVITGQDQANQSRADVFLNNGGLVFSQQMSNAFFAQQYGCFIAGDVDGDGDQDVFQSGFNAGMLSSGLFLNDGSGNFTLSTSVFEPLNLGEAMFFDLEADGDLDLVHTGENSSTQKRTIFYVNDGNGQFTTDMNNSLTGVFLSGIDAADVDGDADIDLMVTGRDQGGQRSSILYLNDGNGVFSISTQTFTQVNSSSVDFADIDNDSDQDLILTGTQAGPDVAEIYLNDGVGGFSLQAGPGLIEVWNSDVSLSDIDLDGDLDLLVCGTYVNAQTCKLYLNDGTGQFQEDVMNSFVGVAGGEADFADLDNDGDDDLVICGFSTTVPPQVAVMYENSNSPNNVQSITKPLVVEFAPNPAQDWLHLNPAQGVGTLVIRTVEGKTVLDIPKPGSSVYLGDLHPGVYLIEAILDEAVSSIPQVLVITGR